MAQIRIFTSTNKEVVDKELDKIGFGGYASTRYYSGAKIRFYLDYHY